MSLQTDFNQLLPAAETQVLQWLTRRLHNCLELDTLELCTQRAHQIWQLHKDNDFHINHGKTSEQVVHEGPAYDNNENQELRVRAMLTEIATLLADSQTFREVVDEDKPRLLEQTMELIQFGYILVAVEVATGT